MCVLEYIFKKKKQGVHLLRDNEYILSFLEYVCKYSENSLDDAIIEIVRQQLNND